MRDQPICAERLLLDCFHVADRGARSKCLRGGNNSVSVDAVVPVEIRYRSGLAEMFNAEWTHLVTVDGAEPRQCGGMSIDHAHEPAM